MLKIPRSSKSGLKYSGLAEISTDNSWSEYTAFKYLSYKSCLFHFFKSKRVCPTPQLNKSDYMAGIISKYMEFVSDILSWESGGWIHQPHKLCIISLVLLDILPLVLLR